MNVDLPLFQNADLTRLQERRDALVKRVQKMPPYTPGRRLVIYKLQLVTAEMMRIENELRGRRH